MLKGIPALLTADALHALHRMGHGDDVAIVDAYFPAASLARRGGATLVQIPGATSTQLLEAVLQLLPLDAFVDNPCWTMQVVGDSTTPPPAVVEFRERLQAQGAHAPATLERFAFYEGTSSASLILQTGDRRTYANILLRKGVLAP